MTLGKDQGILITNEKIYYYDKVIPLDTDKVELPSKWSRNLLDIINKINIDKINDIEE